MQNYRLEVNLFLKNSIIWFLNEGLHTIIEWIPTPNHFRWIIIGYALRLNPKLKIFLLQKQILDRRFQKQSWICLYFLMNVYV